MLAIKGFITHALMAQNTPGQTALIAELSTQSATYAREKGYYGSVAASDYNLTTFLCQRDGEAVQAPVDVAEHILQVAKYILDKTVIAGDPIFADELLVDLGSHFAASADNFECGEVVNDDRFYAPEWVSWQATGVEENRIKIWFVDSAFRLQYDEFEIVVVPALPLPADFFLPGSQVEAQLLINDAVMMTQRMMEARGDQPETVFRIFQFTYVDPLNSAHRVTSNWGVLIHGLAGDNVDSVKDALVNYILDNSTQTREQWTPVLPDIFKRTEFILVPRWDRYAIPNRLVETGIHSPVSNLTESMQKLQDLLEYPDAHINSHAQLFTHPYKAVSVLVVGGPENRDNLWELTDVFPDYINIASTSFDFNRMSNPTKTWALMFEELLLAAEVVTEFSSVPVGMAKLKRGAVLYVVKSFNNIHYLVAAKSSVSPPLTPV